MPPRKALCYCHSSLPSPQKSQNISAEPQGRLPSPPGALVEDLRRPPEVSTLQAVKLCRNRSACALKQREAMGIYQEMKRQQKSMCCSSMSSLLQTSRRCPGARERQLITPRLFTTPQLLIQYHLSWISQSAPDFPPGPSVRPALGAFVALAKLSGNTDNSSGQCGFQERRKTGVSAETRAPCAGAALGCRARASWASLPGRFI